MVVASFNPDTDLPQMNTVLAEEIARVQVLKSENRVGAIHIAPPSGRVFIEVFADDEAEARTTVESLPMARWWTLECYLTAGPRPNASTPLEF